jgi:DNA-binding NarL/FixJ family response regulator
MKTQRKIRVLIVDGDALTRGGICAHLGRPKTRWRCVQAANAVEAREHCAAQPPQLILIDLLMANGE